MFGFIKQTGNGLIFLYISLSYQKVIIKTAYNTVVFFGISNTAHPLGPAPERLIIFGIHTFKFTFQHIGPGMRQFRFLNCPTENTKIRRRLHSIQNTSPMPCDFSRICYKKGRYWQKSILQVKILSLILTAGKMVPLFIF